MYEWEAKIAELKKIAEIATAAHDAERDRLAAKGLKSKERYEILKPLKAASEKAHSEYVEYSHAKIKGELNKIIRDGAPARAAAARSRSAWKQAKYDAKMKQSAI